MQHGDDTKLGLEERGNVLEDGTNLTSWPVINVLLQVIQEHSIDFDNLFDCQCVNVCNERIVLE